MAPLPTNLQTRTRTLGGTEQSWSRAVSGGTGTTVVAFFCTKPPNIPLLQTSLRHIQNSHHLLRSTISSQNNTFSFSISSSSSLQIRTHSVSQTSLLINPSSKSPFHDIVEHELNHNAWSEGAAEVFFCSVYEVPPGARSWVLVLRFHTAVCDRTTVVGVLGELKKLVSMGSVIEGVIEEKEMEAAMERLVPSGKISKSTWTRGADVLGYSMSSLRLSNLKFMDVKTKRRSEMMRLHLDTKHTAQILTGCKTRGIKLCGLLVAAGLIAAHSMKRRLTTKKKHYGVVTLSDCRPELEPPLSTFDFGFYHAAVMNVHSIKGGEKIWETAIKCYTAFSDSKKSNKHFSDMADLNFLMCKAIDHPSLTPSSSLRTSFMSVFEDTVVDSSESEVEDYVGCSSVHGVGPSMAVFDTVRDGELDCALVYPTPLHGRTQMEELVGKMKTLLVEAARNMMH